ncbi:MAG: class I SAM-dependent methyltransferase [Thiohalomonadales bacterium]
MKNDELYNNLLERLNLKLIVLKDKPEETASSTLKALWLTASGKPSSAQASEHEHLPDLNKEQTEGLLKLIERRFEGEPLAYLTGRQQFMGIELLTGSEALVPRIETELLGNTSIQYLNKISNERKSLNVIDVCTGVGNLAISYAINEPKAKVYAADLSPDAVSIARKNTEYHHLESQVKLTESDLLAAYESSKFYNKVDLLSCNPPYISSRKVAIMDEEISLHEPGLAFDGGPFGLKILQRLIREAPKYLRAGGCLIFEVGLGQGEFIIQRIIKMKLYKDVLPVKNNDGDIRVVIASV